MTTGNSIEKCPSCNATINVHWLKCVVCKAALVKLSSWSELESAVQACCDARGDDEKNRLALLADCRQEPADKWSWFIWYFQQEVAKWTH